MKTPSKIIYTSKSTSIGADFEKYIYESRSEAILGIYPNRDNPVRKPADFCDLPSIEDIFVAKRSYDFVLRTQPAQGCLFHFWAPKCSGGLS